MAVIKVINSKAGIAKAINYVTKEEKTLQKLIHGKDCNPETAIDEMNQTKELWRKTEGRQYKHYVQSFNPEEVTADQAHEIGKKLTEIERFKGHEVLMATHVDRDHIHNHFIVNSVGFKDGKKLRESKFDLQALKDRNDALCKEYGLTIPEKGKEITSFEQGKYKSLERAITGDYKSYVLDCYKTVSEIKDKAISREDFITRMSERGYDTSWSDNRKHITFADQDGNKVRNSNLEKTFKESFGKEDLERGFERNHETTRAIDEAREQLRTVRNEGVDRTATADPSGTKIGDPNALIEMLNATIRSANEQVSLDDSQRADRITREQSLEREQNRAREQKTLERKSRNEGYER